jgi:hypothetical protein
MGFDRQVGASGHVADLQQYWIGVAAIHSGGAFGSV